MFDFVENLRREQARRSMLHLWPRMMPTYDFTEPVHRYVADILERVSAREEGYDRVMFVMMPGVGKSTMLRSFFASELCRKPGTRSAYISAAERLTFRNSMDTMDLVRDPKFPWSPITFDDESKSHWSLSNGSEVYAISAGAVITGFRFDNLVALDDIQPDEMTPERVDDLELWLRRTFETRLDPPAVVVGLQSRWGPDDIIARLQNGPDPERWKIISLPAIALEDDPLRRKVGEPLSKRWPVEKLEQKKKTMGSVQFASQYQGDPMPEDSAVFRKDWMQRRYDVLPTNLTARVIALDTAWKTGSQNDYSACVHAGIDPQGNIFIIDAWHRRLVYPELKARVLSYYQEHLPTCVAIEDAASGSALIAEFIHSTSIPIRRLTSTDAKEARAAALSVHFENGKIFLPKSAPWLEDYVEEFVRFGSRGTRHDDFCDATELAVRALRMIKRNSGPVFAFGSIDGPAPRYSRY